MLNQELRSPMMIQPKLPARNLSDHT